MESKISNWDYAILALGVIMIAIGVILRVEGQILGDRTTGMATIIGFMGVIILSGSARRVLSSRLEEIS
ncbi:MAG: hypothetical protein ACE5I5_09575 [Candidatus Heimdallarchaeota archaeon]